jgi:hypothetical protein
MSELQFEEENNYTHRHKSKKTKSSFVSWFYKKSPLRDSTDKTILEVVSIIFFGLAVFGLLVTFYFSEQEEQERIESFRGRVENTRSIK